MQKAPALPVHRPLAATPPAVKPLLKPSVSLPAVKPITVVAPAAKPILKPPVAPPQRFVVAEVIQQTKDVKTLRLKPEAGGLVHAFKPGMFIYLHLIRPGGTWTNYSAAYSLASSPTERAYYEVSFKLKGPFTHELWKFVSGSVVGVSPPQGRNHYHENTDLVLVAGGIGIAPCIGLLRYAAALGSKSNITLLCSDRTAEDVVYSQELAKLSSFHPNFKVVHTLTRAPPGGVPAGFESGRIDEQFLRRHVHEPAKKHWFLCGSVEMTKALVHTLHKPLAVPLRHIRFESWG